MIKLFTHTDLDGIGCTILAKLAFGENIDICYCDYGNINEEVEKLMRKKETISECHITDISIKEELAEKINHNINTKNIQLLDHHPTALDLNKYSWCMVKIQNDFTKIKTSGTELYYNWLISHGYLKNNDALLTFVQTVRDYDTWRWAELGENGIICKQLNDLFGILGRDEFISWSMKKIREKAFPELSETDLLLLKLTQREIDEYIKGKEQTMLPRKISGYNAGVIFADKYVSEMGNNLCKKHPELDFIMIIDMDGKISYRTIQDDINLGKLVADLFGGGGHPKAAGAQIKDEIRDVLVDVLLDNLMQ